MRKIGSLLLALLLFASLLSACTGSQNGISESKKKEIETAWLNQEGSELIWYTDDDLDTADSGMRYYGTYNGYDILYYPVPGVPSGFAAIGDELFQGRTDFRLYGYQDGTFRALTYLYQDGQISDEQLSGIAAQHHRHEEEIYKMLVPWEG